jgi:beta-glucosidase
VEVTAAVAEHRPLVRKAAEEAIVLLQNRPHGAAGPLLPFSAQPHKIALIGPLADSTADMLGFGGETNRIAGVVTVKDALEARESQAGGSVLHAKGTGIDSTSEDGFAAALDAARQAELVVMAMGEAVEMSGEGGSRAYLGLPGNQQKLLEAVASLGRPIVLLVFSGRPLALDWAAGHIDAIAEAWFPGTEAGSAIANVLYGDIAPSGKLPISFPRAAGQVPLYHSQFPTGRPLLHLDPSNKDARFFSRYLDVPNEPLFAFGHGLSYTRFAYSGVSVSRASVPLGQAERAGAGGLVTATATVRNAGSRAADEIVECYVRNLGASLTQPVRSLKGFKRVTLQPGETKQVSFDLGFSELSFYNNAGQAVIESTHYTVWVGGSAEAQEHADFDIAP